MRTVEPAIQRADVRGTILGFECEGLCAGRTPLLEWCVQKGIEQNVDAADDEVLGPNNSPWIFTKFKGLSLESWLLKWAT